ncbi:MAG: Dyp-type peroxidase [Bdellovibrionaceae bacterium]|nr:Dyp-type peroxidase [Pseudobdellovibrionaceae bacterium]
MLELSEIQSGVLKPRPSPYAATYLILRIEDPESGRNLMKRASRIVSSVADPESRAEGAWVSVALSFEGLKALGVPQESLDSFPVEFRQGMAARAPILLDRGSNDPIHWEYPFNSRDMHVVITGLAPARDQLDQVLRRADEIFRGMRGVTQVWRQDCFAPEDDKEAFGYRDGISHPAVEGSGIPGSNPHEKPIKAGEFVLGYEDEMGVVIPPPQPVVLGRNGTYVALRKLHQNVAAFRSFLKERAKDRGDEELIAAKMMGRWRSGAPLALCPHQDDPELGADPRRNNGFLFHEDDKIGYKTPPGCHIRRMNPRDGLKDSGTAVNIRRMIRRGTSYGPSLPEGILQDDGVDRGLMFLFIGAHLRRQFEFVQAAWTNDGEFIGAGSQPDPVAGATVGQAEFVIPQRPIRRTLKGIPQFVTTRGGEYFFMPSLSALRWLGELGK